MISALRPASTRRPLRLAVGVRLGAVLALAGALPLACASDSWDRAMDEDRPEVFYQFIRDNPDSPRVEEARERLAFFELRRNPTLANFNDFVDRHPDSPFADEIRPQLEESAFRVARGIGTADAYDAFLRRFPDGPEAARARGNAAFLAADGYGGDPVALADFAERHPESDFAAEARRSAASLSVREQSRFREVALDVAVDATTPEADRLLRAFDERARETYEAAGVRLHGASSDGSPPATAAVLRIDHREVPVEASVDGDELTRPGFEALTVVSLTAPAQSTPLWRREFRLRVDPAARSDDASILFGAEGRRYWEAFFVPVASWHSAAAVRAAQPLASGVADVQAAGDRAVVLFEDGRIEVVELSDPSRPVPLVEQPSGPDLTTWAGLRVVPTGVVAFGQDGLAAYGFAEGGLRPLRRHDRAQVGSITAMAPLGAHWVVGSRRGLLLVDPEEGAVMRLLSRGVEGLDAKDGRVLFTDGDRLYLSSLPLLQKRRVLAQLELAGQQLRGVWMFGDVAVAVGARATFVLATPSEGTPRLVAKLPVERTGPVRDAALARGRLFLLGARGLLAVDPRDWSPGEMVDVTPDQALATMGRHLVAVGSAGLQVVDSTPFTSRAPAPLPADAGFGDAER